MKRLILDAGPLGRLAHPRRRPEVSEWLRKLLSSDWQIIVPEIADYEVRRELLRGKLTRSIRRLDGLYATFAYLPISTAAMRRAAELWAEARQTGQPTADPAALDGDVILAAQALEVDGVVATDNVRHLARYVDARDWLTFSAEPEE